MKKLKLIMALAAAFVCLNFVFAENPTKGKETNLADMVIDKLNNDVQLTDSQKLAIRDKVVILVQSREIANSKGNKEEILSAKKMAQDQYKMALNSILTDNQKEQLTTKQNERKEMNKNKFNK